MNAWLSCYTCTLQVPIIAPIKPKKAELLEQQPLKTNYNNEFLSGMMTNPELIRNVAVVGHLHHGKTLVRDNVLFQICPLLCLSNMASGQYCCKFSTSSFHIVVCTILYMCCRSLGASADPSMREAASVGVLVL